MLGAAVDGVGIDAASALSPGAGGGLSALSTPRCRRGLSAGLGSAVVHRGSSTGGSGWDASTSPTRASRFDGALKQQPSLGVPVPAVHDLAQPPPSAWELAALHDRHAAAVSPGSTVAWNDVKLQLEGLRLGVGQRPGSKLLDLMLDDEAWSSTNSRHGDPGELWKGQLTDAVQALHSNMALLSDTVASLCKEVDAVKDLEGMHRRLAADVAALQRSISGSAPPTSPSPLAMSGLDDGNGIQVSGELVENLRLLKQDVARKIVELREMDDFILRTTHSRSEQLAASLRQDLQSFRADVEQRLRIGDGRSSAAEQACATAGQQVQVLRGDVDRRLKAVSALHAPLESAETSRRAHAMGEQALLHCQQLHNAIHNLAVASSPCSPESPGRRRAEQQPVSPRSVLVSGAGGKRGVILNGMYRESGSVNDRPKYKQIQGDGIIYFEEYWKLFWTDHHAGWCCSVPGVASMEPPTGLWSTHGYFGGDVLPPRVERPQSEELPELPSEMHMPPLSLPPSPGGASNAGIGRSPSMLKAAAATEALLRGGYPQSKHDELHERLCSHEKAEEAAARDHRDALEVHRVETARSLQQLQDALKAATERTEHAAATAAEKHAAQSFALTEEAVEKAAEQAGAAAARNMEEQMKNTALVPRGAESHAAIPVPSAASPRSVYNTQRDLEDLRHEVQNLKLQHTTAEKAQRAAFEAVKSRTPHKDEVWRKHDEHARALEAHRNEVSTTAATLKSAMEQHKAESLRHLEALNASLRQDLEDAKGHIGRTMATQEEDARSMREAAVHLADCRVEMKTMMQTHSQTVATLSTAAPKAAPAAQLTHADVLGVCRKELASCEQQQAAALAEHKARVVEELSAHAAAMAKQHLENDGLGCPPPEHRDQAADLAAHRARVAEELRAHSERTEDALALHAAALVEQKRVVSKYADAQTEALSDLEAHRAAISAELAAHSRRTEEALAKNDVEANNRRAAHMDQVGLLKEHNDLSVSALQANLQAYEATAMRREADVDTKLKNNAAEQRAALQLHEEDIERRLTRHKEEVELHIKAMRSRERRREESARHMMPNEEVRVSPLASSEYNRVPSEARSEDPLEVMRADIVATLEAKAQDGGLDDIIARVTSDRCDAPKASAEGKTARPDHPTAAAQQPQPKQAVDLKSKFRKNLLGGLKSGQLEKLVDEADAMDDKKVTEAAAAEPFKAAQNVPQPTPAVQQPAAKKGVDLKSKFRNNLLGGLKSGQLEKLVVEADALEDGRPKAPESAPVNAVGTAEQPAHAVQQAAPRKAPQFSFSAGPAEQPKQAAQEPAAQKAVDLKSKFRKNLLGGLKSGQLEKLVVEADGLEEDGNAKEAAGPPRDAGAQPDYF
eukprot:TRINITY_DN4167_c0_g1_i1.p1 TRINITY_DN4167_c0_g1~~TRINITY_DN4167_c0_g1_i1.p1  ORF type:complete len:1364 (-),score=398.83 TRINITY_DN4167_c0_g1_i1:69-4160(-)